MKDKKTGKIFKVLPSLLIAAALIIPAASSIDWNASKKELLKNEASVVIAKDTVAEVTMDENVVKETSPPNTESVELVDNPNPVVEDCFEGTAGLEDAEPQEEPTQDTYYEDDDYCVYRECSDEDAYFLAKIIETEAGYSYNTDEHQLMVGSVVLNRVASPAFPNTIYEVFYQGIDSGCKQYAQAGTEWFDNTIPSDRALSNARYLLEYGSIAPPGVVFQAEFPQGEIYRIYDYGDGAPTYICYGS